MPKAGKASSARLLTGAVRHRRYEHAVHKFQYSTAYLWLDIQNLASVFDRCIFWSLEKANLVSFRQSDYFSSEPGSSLTEKLVNRIRQETGEEFNGSIYMLAHLRYWGHHFNPVVFYYCYSNGELKYILAEINNTPWDEKFTYVLALDKAVLRKDTREKVIAKFIFNKAFHVSPFMPMDLEYDWRFYETLEAERNADSAIDSKADENDQSIQQPEPQQMRSIHMILKKDAKLLFDATLSLKAEELSTAKMYVLPFRYGLNTLKTIAAIYWQALRLLLKKVPFYSYPKAPVTHTRKQNDH